MDAKAVATFAVAAVVLVSMVSMASADSQTWYLDSDEHFTGYYMWKGSDSECDGQIDVSLLGLGESLLWIADEPAECDVTFPAGTWTGQLEWSAGLLIVGLLVDYSIGVYDPATGQFTADGGTSTQLLVVPLDLSSGTTTTFSIAADSFTVPEGKYLAFQFSPLVHIDVARSILTQGDSWIQYPYDQPPYPVSELSTIALFSTGLLALAGFVVYRRKRREL
jgi:hypothetical protein